MPHCLLLLQPVNVSFVFRAVKFINDAAFIARYPDCFYLIHYNFPSEIMRSIFSSLWISRNADRISQAIMAGLIMEFEL